MAKKKTKKKETKNLTTASLPKLGNGEVAYLTNIDGNYVLSQNRNTEIKESQFANYVNISQKSSKEIGYLYDRILSQETSSYSTTQSELSSLAQNTQTDIDKIIKINGIVKYNVNRDDIIGKTIEVIENNINTRYTMVYPRMGEVDAKSKDKEIKMKNELSLAIDTFNEQIDIGTLIVQAVNSVYTEGNYIFYLKGNINDGYGVVKYPLGYAEITNRLVSGEPLVAFNVGKLKSEMQNSVNKYKGMKAKPIIDIPELIDKEIQRDYPEEVYNGFKSNDEYAFLSPDRIGVCRINNFGQAYGLTPMFKALSPLLTLETIDDTDRKNISAKAKKIIFQKMRKEAIGTDGSVDFNAIGYGQASLLQAMQEETVIYTGNPFIESLEILEPKTDATDNSVVLSNRNRVFNALGISFITNESKQSMNTVKISYEDLLKTINKITKTFEKVLNRFYKSFCRENGFPPEYAPKIEIHDTKLLDTESQLKLVDLYYSKIGLSYQTVFENLGIDYVEEVNRRTQENELDFESIFTPHGNSYTANSNEIVEDNKNSNNSKKSENVDKSLDDKARKQAE